MRRVEKMIPLGRLTCILMPHHAATSSLRPRDAVTTASAAKRKEPSLSSDMRTWTAIKMLKYGLEKKLYRKTLKKEGNTLCCKNRYFLANPYSTFDIAFKEFSTVRSRPKKKCAGTITSLKHFTL
jgi:hypothetical protein